MKNTYGKSAVVLIMTLSMICVVSACSDEKQSEKLPNTTVTEQPQENVNDDQQDTDDGNDNTSDVENDLNEGESNSSVENGDSTNEDNVSSDIVDDTFIDEEEELNDAQKNSIAMLNYLATLSREINDSKNSRMFLEEAYASLINNTNPEKVNELTESHLSSLLDIIEKYRLITVKRERLQYIYDQNKALAIKDAVPNPVALLSAATSLDLKRLAGSVIYMAVDSYSSYKTYNNELDNEFLQEGWILDDEEAENLHDSRKRAFMFMLEIVREEELPGELALNETAVKNFVSWKNNDNVYQRIQFLESEEKTYNAFGNYWLELAESYYEIGEYNKCLESIDKYEKLEADIFRKDYYFAQIMPKVLVAATEVYSTEDYIPVAERYLEILMENTELTEWSLRYFAAQMYIDLYTKTQNIQYLDKAYEVTLNNVNNLIEEQKVLNDTYLADVTEVAIPDDATKEEKKQIKEYNKSLKNERKTELPPVYEPLVLNCDLLFALAKERNISASEKSKVDGILNGAFLSETYKSRYSFSKSEQVLDAEFNKNELVIPVEFLSENATIKVMVTVDGKQTEYDDWIVKKVERQSEEIKSFTTLIVSEKAKKQTWSADSRVKVAICDGENYEPIIIDFEVSNYKEGWAVLPDTVEFEQVN